MPLFAHRVTSSGLQLIPSLFCAAEQRSHKILRPRPADRSALDRPAVLCPASDKRGHMLSPQVTPAGAEGSNGSGARRRERQCFGP